MAAKRKAASSSERRLEVPADLAAAIARSKAAESVWASYSYSHRKEYVQWVLEAKKPETRAARIEKAVEMIAKGSGQKR